MYSYFGEYGVEMKAIADFFEIDVGIIVTLNLGYELRRVSHFLHIQVWGQDKTIQISGYFLESTYVV